MKDFIKFFFVGQVFSGASLLGYVLLALALGMRLGYWYGGYEEAKAVAVKVDLQKDNTGNTFVFDQGKIFKSTCTTKYPTSGLEIATQYRFKSDSGWQVPVVVPITMEKFACSVQRVSVILEPLVDGELKVFLVSQIRETNPGTCDSGCGSPEKGGCECLPPAISVDEFDPPLDPALDHGMPPFVGKREPEEIDFE